MFTESETAWRRTRKRTQLTYLGDRPLGPIPVAGHGGGGRLSTVASTRLGLKGSHGLGNSGSESELLPQLHIGPTLGYNGEHKVSKISHKTRLGQT